MLGGDTHEHFTRPSLELPSTIIVSGNSRLRGVLVEPSQVIGK